MKEYDFDFRMMGSDAHISIITSAEGIAETVYQRMRIIAEAEEARYSRFREESELSVLNRERTRTVSRQFMDTFLCARELHASTQGAFNPLVDISRYGYDADLSKVKGIERSRATSAPYNTDLLAVGVDEARMTIALQEGQRLDFGGFLKGRVAHMMADEAELCTGVIVNIGGDIFTRGVDVDGEPFSFSIDNPFAPSEDLVFTAVNSGIATSGSYNRTWFLEGRPFHHILDASGTKNAESDVVSATVVAPTGAKADAFATIAMVQGSIEGARILTELGCAYFLICLDGSVVASPSFLQEKASPISYAH